MFAAIVGQDWADDAHPFSLEVNGTDVIASVPMESIRVEMAGPGTNGSLTFTVYDATAAVAITAWDEVRLIEHAATRPILFGGFVQSVRYVAWATGGRSVEVQCVGYGVLLDRKVVLSLVTTTNEGVAGDIQAAVSRFGGRVSALRAPGTGYMDATYSLPSCANWVHDPATYSDGSSLRAAIDTAGQSGWYGPDVYSSTGLTYWVDEAALLRAAPDFPASVEAGDVGYAYDGGTVPGLTVDVTAGTYRITQLAYEEEDSDRITAVYVVGGNAASTGWYTTPPPERAGDLQAYGTSSRTDEYTIPIVGGAVVMPTLGLTVRGTVGIEAATPIDARPGRNLRLTAAQLGQSAADYRITGVRIAFLGGAHREYTIDYGGSAGAPSLARRSGRYATI